MCSPPGRTSTGLRTTCEDGSRRFHGCLRNRWLAERSVIFCCSRRPWRSGHTREDRNMIAHSCITTETRILDNDLRLSQQQRAVLWQIRAGIIVVWLHERHICFRRANAMRALYTSLWKTLACSRVRRACSCRYRIVMQLSLLCNRGRRWAGRPRGCDHAL